MPHTKSAKKRLRQSLERRTRNRNVKSTLKTEVKKAREASKGTDATKSAAAVSLVTKRADQAAAKGVIHKNAAARIKSRMAKFAKKAKAAAK
ncbi:MAG: 30S ribosomal protein S20 [Planctomycetes bacterium]|nr:30S ribosomal protein S20 [Planctomycetota bacterium]